MTHSLLKQASDSKEIERVLLRSAASSQPLIARFDHFDVEPGIYMNVLHLEHNTLLCQPLASSLPVTTGTVMLAITEGQCRHIVLAPFDIVGQNMRVDLKFAHIYTQNRPHFRLNVSVSDKYRFIIKSIDDRLVSIDQRVKDISLSGCSFIMDRALLDTGAIIRGLLHMKFKENHTRIETKGTVRHCSTHTKEGFVVGIEFQCLDAETSRQILTSMHQSYQETFIFQS